MMDIDHIRKLASLEQGRQYLEERFGPKEVDATASVLLSKAGSASDPGLLRIAGWLPGDTLETYEALGGTFEKSAIGAPMFQMNTPSPQVAAPRPTMPRVGAPQSSGPSTAGGGTAGGGIPQVSTPSIPEQQEGIKTSSMKFAGEADRHLRLLPTYAKSLLGRELHIPPVPKQPQVGDLEKLLRKGNKGKFYRAARQALRGAVGGTVGSSFGYAPLAALGALYGGAAVAHTTGKMTEKKRKELEEKGGPIASFGVRHPFVHGAALGVTTIPLALGPLPLKPSKRNVAAAVGRAFVPLVAATLADEALRLKKQGKPQAVVE